MISTIIVDDEIWVIKLISKLINWEQMGFCVSGVADNGEDALDLIREKLPQVMIADIRMPGNNGLTLIEQAKLINPDIQVVIVSGYGEFDYAKTALELGVFAYLLKPVDKGELENVLIKIRGEIKKDRNQAELLEELRQSQERRKTEYFRQLLMEPDCEIKNEETLNLEFNSNFVSGEYLALNYVLVYPRHYGKENQQTKRDLLKSIYGVVDEGFRRRCAETVKLEIDNSIVLIVNYSPEYKEEIDKSIDESYTRITGMPFFSTGHILKVGVSIAEKHLSKLRDAYADSVAAAGARIYQTDAKIIRCPLEYEHSTLENIVPVELEKRLRRMVEIHDSQETEILISNVLKPQTPLHPDDLFYTTDFITDIFFRAWRPHEKLLSEYGISGEDTQNGLRNCQSIDEMIELFVSIVNEVQRLTSDTVSSQQEKIVNQVKSFIHKHYGEKLSLETICEAVFFSPQYVCSVFKQEEGVTIVDYLTDYRIRVARELLLNKQYRTNDVMMMVGYQDAKYFCKVFKKNMGITPSEYRKMFC